MVYKIRISAREKQAECSAILFLSFFIIFLTGICMNLMPLVYAAFQNYIGDNPIINLAVSVALLIFSGLIYSALSMGTDRFMLKRAENFAAGAGDIFYYFAPKKLLSLCGFHLMVNSRKILILSFLSIPTLICAGVFYALCENGFSAAVCLIFAVFSLVFLLSEIITFRRISDTLFMARYVFIKGEYLNKKQLLSLCDESEIKRLRQLRLSFSGWFLLCLLVFPLPYVWSYYRQSKACFASRVLNM